MSAPERSPLQELLRYVLVGGGMALTVLLLSRGKWLIGAVVGLWVLAAGFGLFRRGRRDRGVG